MKGTLLSVLKVLALAFYLLGTSASAFNEAQLMRRLFIDAIGKPPSITEIEYLNENTNSYNAAIELIFGKDRKYFVNIQHVDVLRRHFESKEYLQASASPLTVEQRENIIRYQSQSDTSDSVEVARKKLALCANAYIDTSELAAIDWLSQCLLARTTTVAEANELLLVYRKYTSSTAGLLAVVRTLEKFHDFTHK